MIRQARTTDGNIVALSKECSCLDTIHEGPHWLHSDRLWRNSNMRMLDIGNGAGFSSEEHARIREKIHQMEKRGIEDLIGD